MRDLAKPRELASPELVEDLPGLLFGEVVDLVALVAREKAERPARDVGIPPERLVRRDEPVATEGHRVPGDAGRRIRSARVELEQRPQVERAPGDETLVEHLRARRVPRARPQESPVTSVERVDRVVEPIGRRRRGGTVLARDDRKLQLQELLRPERSCHAKDVPFDRVRRGAQGDLGRPSHSVPADALKDQPALARAARRGERGKAQIAVGAHREHVPECGLEFELDAHVDRMRVCVEDADPLTKAVREKTRPPDRERVGGVPRGTEHGAFGMHELERRDVVLLGVRRQQEGPGPVHAEGVAREVLRVVVVEAERAHRAERQAPILLGDEDDLVLL